MTDDPEFDADLARIREKIRLDREAANAEMAEALRRRFERRGGPWKPKNPAVVDTPDYKQAGANDR